MKLDLIKAYIENNSGLILDEQHFGLAQELELMSLGQCLAEESNGKIPSPSGDFYDKEFSNQFWFKIRKILREFGFEGKNNNGIFNGIYPKSDKLNFELGSIIVKNLNDNNIQCIPKGKYNPRYYQKLDDVGITQQGRNWVISYNWWITPQSEFNNLAGGIWLLKKACNLPNKKGRPKKIPSINLNDIDIKELERILEKYKNGEKG